MATSSPWRMPRSTSTRACTISGPVAYSFDTPSSSTSSGERPAVSAPSAFTSRAPKSKEPEELVGTLRVALLGDDLAAEREIALHFREAAVGDAAADDLLHRVVRVAGRGDVHPALPRLQLRAEHRRRRAG